MHYRKTDVKLVQNIIVIRLEDTISSQDIRDALREAQYFLWRKKNRRK